jgi:hypothetical protein
LQSASVAAAEVVKKKPLKEFPHLQQQRQEGRLRRLRGLALNKVYVWKLYVKQFACYRRRRLIPPSTLHPARIYFSVNSRNDSGVSSPNWLKR